MTFTVNVGTVNFQYPLHVFGYTKLEYVLQTEEDTLKGFSYNVEHLGNHFFKRIITNISKTIVKRVVHVEIFLSELPK